MTVSTPSESGGDNQEFEGNNPLQQFYDAFKVEEGGSEEYSRSVTRLMHQYHDGDTANREAIKNDLWEAVMDQLVAKATAVKESYPRLWELPEAMVSDVFKELDNVLQDVSLDNREQFYAIAGLRFHWLLLKKLKTNKTQDVSLEVIPDPADPDSSPAEVAEEEDLIRTILEEVGKLPEVPRSIFLLHTWFSFTYTKIGEVVDLSRNRVCEIFKDTEKLLAKKMAQDDDA